MRIGANAVFVAVNLPGQTYMQFTTKQLFGVMFQFAAVFGICSVTFPYISQTVLGVDRPVSKFSVLSAAIGGTLGYTYILVRNNRRQRNSKPDAG